MLSYSAREVRNSIAKTYANLQLPLPACHAFTLSGKYMKLPLAPGDYRSNASIRHLPFTCCENIANIPHSLIVVVTKN